MAQARARAKLVNSMIIFREDRRQVLVGPTVQMQRPRPYGCESVSKLSHPYSCLAPRGSTA